MPYRFIQDFSLACAGLFILLGGLLGCPGSWGAGPISQWLTICPSPCPSSCSSGLDCLPELYAGRTLLGRPSLAWPRAGLQACESGTLIDRSLSKFACLGLSAIWGHSSQADHPLTKPALTMEMWK